MTRRQASEGGTRAGSARLPSPIRNRRPDQIVLRFDAAERSLRHTEHVVLERWLGRWLVERPHGVVVMAHAAGARAGTRRARLSVLRDTVQALGMPRENVKYTEQPLAPAFTAGGTEAVVLRMIEAPSEAQQVQPVANCFDPAAA